MEKVVQKLIDLLDVKSNGKQTFLGMSQDLGFPRVFGGQVLGQALVAATRTVKGRLPHSLHAYFLRPGDPKIDIDYEVDLIRDGKSFTTRRVVASQAGKAIFSMGVSFQLEETGLEYHKSAQYMPGPDGLPSELERARARADMIPERVRDKFTRERPIEIRAVQPVDYFKPEKREPRNSVWMKVIDKLPDDPLIHRCFLAYASDFTILEPVLFPHGMTFIDPRLQVASLDHAMWFHRDFRMDNWIKYCSEATSTSGARGFARGEIFAQDGTMIASVCQEGLLRVHQS